MLSDKRQVLSGSKTLKAEDINLIIRAHFIVICGIRKCQGKHTLLLQVGLVDTGKRTNNDRKSTQESRLEGSVLARRTFTVIGVTNNDPFNTMVTIMSSSLGHAAPLAGDLVPNFVGLAILNVDSTNETVLRDVLEVSTVLQPGTTSRDVVRRALAFDLNQDRKISGGLSIPRFEGLEKLKTFRGGTDGYFDSSAVLRRGLEGILPRVVTARGKFMTAGILEFERLPITSNELISDRVEGKPTGEGQSGNDVR